MPARPGAPGRVRTRSIVALALAIAALFGAGVAELLAGDGAPAPVPSPSPSPTPSPSATPSRTPLTEPCGSSRAPHLITWHVAVEPDLGTSVGALARRVREALCHPRGWTAGGAVRFRFAHDGRFLIGLRSAASTEERCLELIGQTVERFYSCAGLTEVALNADRWFGGSPNWPGSLPRYRRMLVNHEVGHLLGMRHEVCETAGVAAPVMMQQSIGLQTDDRTCLPNPWPTEPELALLPPIVADRLALLDERAAS